MKIAKLDRLKQLKRHHKILLLMAGILAIFFCGLFFVNQNNVSADLSHPDNNTCGFLAEQGCRNDSIHVRFQPSNTSSFERGVWYQGSSCHNPISMQYYSGVRNFDVTTNGTLIGGNTDNCEIACIHHIGVQTGVASTLDTTAPTVSNTNAQGGECTTITGSIHIQDMGCGSGIIHYKWLGGSEYTTNNNVILYRTGYQSQPTGFSLKYDVRDNASGHNNNKNLKTGSISFTWQDSSITVGTSTINLGDLGNGKSVYTGVIKLFDAKDGACGHTGIKVISGFCSDGVSLTRSGYYGNAGSGFRIIPSPSFNGNGECKIIFKDDENTHIATGTIIFYRNFNSCLGVWDNNNFLSSEFWNSYAGNNQTGHEQVICALYGSSQDTDTAYTKGWSGYDYYSCLDGGMTVVETGVLPTNLTANTIYVLTTGKVISNTGIAMNNCSAIISKNGSVLYTNAKKFSSIYSSWKQYGILENISVDGTNDGNGGTHNKNGIGISLGYSNNNTLNNIKVYNNNDGIYTESINYTILNNILLFSNNYGFDSAGPSYFCSFNNIQCFNNDEVGILLEAYTGSSLNNVLSYNNGNYGIDLDSSSVYLNNIWSYNNSGAGINIWTSSKYYGTLSLFGNGDTIVGYTSALSAGSTSDTAINGLGWSAGTYTNTGIVSWDLMTNPKNSNGNYLLGWSVSSWSNLRGTGTIGEVTAYSYGSEINTQAQPVAWSGGSLIPVGNHDDTKYIGSQTKKLSGNLLILSDWVQNTVIGTGYGISHYSIFGEIERFIFDSTISNSTGINFINFGDYNNVITQIYKTGYLNTYYTHFQKNILSIDPCLSGWDNDNFLDDKFWNGTSTYSGWNDFSDNTNLQRKYLICALYGSGPDDKTAYTVGWSGWNYSQCSGGAMEFEVVQLGFNGNLQHGTISNQSLNLQSNTIYIIKEVSNGNTIPEGFYINMPSCTAIVGNGIPTIVGDIKFDNGINLSGNYSILDNFSLNGKVAWDSDRNHSGHKNGISVKGSNNTLNNLRVYNNETAINLNKTMNVILNNIHAFNNTRTGIYASGISNTFNNIYTYNNTDGIVSLGNSNNRNILNNIFTFNNAGIGIKVSGLSAINNIYSHNNNTGFNVNASHVNEYGYIMSMGNSWTGTMGLLTTSPLSSIGWTSSHRTYTNTVSRDYVVNPATENGEYLLSWSGNLESLRGEKPNYYIFEKYSFGSGMSKQVQPVINTELTGGNYAQDHFLGSDVSEITGQLQISSNLTTGHLTVTGISNVGTHYSIFGQIEQNKIGVNINSNTGIELTGNNGEKNIITQLYNSGNFATHFQSTSTLNTSGLLCTISVVDDACSSTGIQLKVDVMGASSGGRDSNNLESLYSSSITTYTGVSETGTYSYYIWDSLYGYDLCDITINENNLDKISPSLGYSSHITGYECSIISGNISAVDSGCGVGSLIYQRNGSGSFDVNTKIFSEYSSIVRLKTGYISVKDGVLNEVTGAVTFEWIDSPITGDSIINIGSIGDSHTFDVISTLNIKDGNCGTGTIWLSGSIVCSEGNSAITGTNNWNMITISHSGNTTAGHCEMLLCDDESSCMTGTIAFGTNKTQLECSDMYRWDNDKFLDEYFWSGWISAGQKNDHLICALYGTENTDTTAYTKGWSDWNWSNSCDVLNMNVKKINNYSDFSNYCNGKTGVICILDDNIPVTNNGRISLGNCSAIISQSGYTIYSDAVINNNGLINLNMTQFSLLDNLSIEGKNKSVLNNNYHNPNSYGIYINNSMNNTLNTINMYDNNLGLYINSGQHIIINNIQSFNNANFGIQLNNASKNSINNSQVYNNGKGISINGSYNIFNQISSYNNNGTGIDILSSDNRFYNIYLFNNRYDLASNSDSNKICGTFSATDNTNYLVMANDCSSQSNIITQPSWDIVTNPMRSTETGLLSRLTGSNQKGTHDVGIIKYYSYGKDIPLQIQPLIWSGNNIIMGGDAKSDKYIGSNTKHVTGVLYTKVGVHNGETMIVTGTSEDTNIDFYSVFGQIEQSKTGIIISQGTGVTLKSDTGNKLMIIQLYGTDQSSVATHFWKEIPTTIPTCTLDIGTEYTNSGVYISISGDNAVFFSWDGEDWAGEISNFFATENGIYTGYVKNSAEVVGYCTGEVTAIDRTKPEIISFSGFTTLGLACTNDDIFTGNIEFSESISGFDISDFVFTGGLIIDLVGQGKNYSFTGVLSGGSFELSIGGDFTDIAGNTLSGNSNIITGYYDIYGPIINLSKPSNGITLPNTSTNLLRSGMDEGCADISGYYYEVWTGDNEILYTGYTTTTGISITGLKNENTYYRHIIGEDNFGNTGSSDTWYFMIDTNTVSCEFVITGENCSSEYITLILTGWGNITDIEITKNDSNSDRFNINYLSSKSRTGTINDIITGVVSNNITSGVCVWNGQGLDYTAPTISGSNYFSGLECETITGLLELIDTGCANNELLYQWNGGEISGINLFATGIDTTGNLSVSFTGFDNIGNSINTIITFEWFDAILTGTWYYEIDETLSSIWTGRDIFDAKAGSCETITMNLISCTAGNLDISGTELTITPPNDAKGTGSCNVQITDGDTIQIGTISFRYDTRESKCLPNWDNNKFLNSGFWNSWDGFTDDGKNQLICALFGENRNDKTAYTIGRSGWNWSDSCTGNILDLNMTGILPNNGVLQDNTIYVLVNNKQFSTGVILGNCTAIISSGNSHVLTQQSSIPSNLITSSGKHFVILDNISLNGIFSQAGQIHNNNIGYGLNFINSMDFTINHVNIYDFYTGIQINNVSHQLFNNINVYNNNNIALVLDKGSRYNSFDNIQIFNNNYGINNLSGENNIFNNISIYNNKYYGLKLYTNNNMWNNILSYNNGNSQMIMGGNIMNNYGYGLHTYNNFTDGGINIPTWLSYNYNPDNVSVSRNVITNPKDTNGNYLNDWTISSFTDIMGPNSGFNGLVKDYSLGSDILLQVQPIVRDNYGNPKTGGNFDNLKFIGSDTEKKLSNTVINPSHTNGLTQINVDSYTGHYSVFGNVMYNVSGDVGEPKSIELSGDQGQKIVVSQLYYTDYFAMHYQNYAILSDTPICTIYPSDSGFVTGLYLFVTGTADNISGYSWTGNLYSSEIDGLYVTENGIYTGYIQDNGGLTGECTYIVRNILTPMTLQCNSDWENNNFLTGRFWSIWNDLPDYDAKKQELICALYGKNENDSTAYTKGWSGWIRNNSCNIGVMDYVVVNSISDLNNLHDNTIYILDEDILEINPIQSLPDCTAIISKNGSTLYSTTRFSNILSLDHTQFSIIDNINIDGSYKGDGGKHNPNDYGLKLINSNNNTINNVNSYNNGYGVFISNSQYSILNNIQSYNNEKDGISLSGNANHTSISNIQTYNNGQNGIRIGASYSIMNNIISYNNNNNGIYIEQPVINNYLQNIKSYNNYMGIKNESAINTTFYGDLYLFGNDFDSQSFLTNNSLAFNNSLINSLTTHQDEKTFSRNDITNPTDRDGKYLLDWATNDLSNLRGVKSTIQETQEYSFGNEIITQSQTLIWSGDEIVSLGNNFNANHFVGSNTEKKSGGIYVDPSLTSGYVFFGITGDTDKFSIFGNISQNIYNIMDNNSGIVLLSGNDGYKRIIGQLWSNGYFATHFETGTILRTAIPTCIIIGDFYTPSNNGITLTISGTSDNIARYSRSGNDWSEISTGVIYESGIVTGYVMDNLGIIGYCTGAIGNLDTQSPNVILSKDDISCYNEETLNITATFSENITGFDIEKLSISGAELISGSLELHGNIGSFMVRLIDNEFYIQLLSGAFTDIAGNNYIENSNILTGSYGGFSPDKVSLSSPISGYVTSITNQTLTWEANEQSGCAIMDHYTYFVCDGEAECTGGNAILSGEISDTQINISNLENGHTYYRNVFATDEFGQTGEMSDTWNFTIDTTIVDCFIVESDICSNNGVILSLSGNENFEYSWDGLFEITGTVKEFTVGNITVTGYVWDPNKSGQNTGLCTYTIQNIDKIPPIVTGGYFTGLECEYITGIVEAADEGCGSDELRYNWAGGLDFFTGMTIFATGSDFVGSRGYTVVVKDGAENTGSSTVTFEWFDDELILQNPEYTISTVITGDYVINNLTGLFNPKAGPCETISITGDVICTSGINTILNGSTLTISGAFDEKIDGNCIVTLTDGDTEKTGTILINTDTRYIHCAHYWDNDYFLTGRFWDNRSTSANKSHELICALYGSGDDDKTAYTIGWKNWDYSQCSGLDMTVVETGSLPSQLEKNTIYVLSGDVMLSETVSLQDCSTVISKNQYSSNIHSPMNVGVTFYSQGKSYTILDNLSVLGLYGGSEYHHNLTEYGIFLDGAQNSTINNLKVYNNNDYGIYLQGSARIFLNDILGYNNVIAGISLINTDETSLNNMKIFNNAQYGLLLQNSNNNDINNTQTHNNGDGIRMIYSNFNIINNIHTYNNSANGIQLVYAYSNAFNDIYSYNNSNGIYTTTNNTNKYFGEMNVFGNTDNNINGIEIANIPNGFGRSAGSANVGIHDLSWDYISNPMNENGSYLLDWRSNFDELRGIKDFAGTQIIYSYGSGISLQNVAIMQGHLRYNAYNTGEFIGGHERALSGMTNITYPITSGHNKVIINTANGLICNLFGHIDNYVTGLTYISSYTTSIKFVGTDGMKNLVTQLNKNDMYTHYQNNAQLDTTGPECTIQSDGICTNGNIVLKLTSVSNDISGYSWIGFNNTMTQNILVKIISDLGVYTGYVVDSIGNTGYCNINITNNLLDKENPTIVNVQNWSGDECSTGFVEINATDTGCGLTSQGGLYYNRLNGEFSGLNKSRIEIYGADTSSSQYRVEISDGAGNSTSTGVSFTWNDIPVKLLRNHIELANSLSISETPEIIDLVSEFGASAGSCETISSSVDCDNNVHWDLASGILKLTGKSGHEGETGSCNVIFSDDDSSITGTISYKLNGVCGDAFIQPELGEECDNGEYNSDTGTCNNMCKWNIPTCTITANQYEPMSGEEIKFNISTNSWAVIEAFEPENGKIITGGNKGYTGIDYIYKKVGSYTPRAIIKNPISGKTYACSTNVTVLGQDLWINKSIINEHIIVNEPITFSIKYGNNGSVDRHVTIIDILPSSFIIDSDEYEIYQGGIILFSGELRAGSRGEILLTGYSEHTGDFVNTVSIIDQYNRSTSSSIDYEVYGLPDLYITKSIIPTSMFVGKNIEYVITYGNKGEYTGYDINIYDILPSGFVANSGNIYGYSGDIAILATGITVAPGEDGQITISGHFISSGVYTNIAMIGKGDIYEKASISKYIRASENICGNGNIETGEYCDDGINNGKKGYCNDKCSSINGTGQTHLAPGFACKYDDAPYLANGAFTDTINHRGYEYIEIMRTSCLHRGKANYLGQWKYFPNESTTKAEVLKTLVKTRGLVKDDFDITSEDSTYRGTQIFNDVPNNHWFAWYTEYAYQNGMTSDLYSVIGNEKYLIPDGIITRNQIIKLMMKLYKEIISDDNIDISGNSNLADLSKMDPYYTYVREAEVLGIIEGYSMPNGTHTWQGDKALTRAEFAKIFSLTFKSILN